MISTDHAVLLKVICCNRQVKWKKKKIIQQKNLGEKMTVQYSTTIYFRAGTIKVGSSGPAGSIFFAVERLVQKTTAVKPFLPIFII